jgi:hypothetical protein
MLFAREIRLDTVTRFDDDATSLEDQAQGVCESLALSRRHVARVRSQDGDRGRRRGDAGRRIGHKI